MEHIYFITPSFKTGGGNRVFFELANQLLDRYNVTIITPNNNLDTNTFNVNNRIKIVSVGKYSKSRIGKIFNIFKVFCHLNTLPKKSICVFSDPIVCLFLKNSKNNINYRFIQADDYRIFDDKHIIKRNLFLKIYKILCQKSYNNKKVNWLFNSKFTYSQFLSLSQLTPPLLLVHPAINQDIFCNNTSSKLEFNICLVARKHPLKGLQNFLNAWDSLEFKIQNKISNIYLIGHDNLSSFELNSKIKVISPKDDLNIAKIYNSSQIFISPSWWEGFGLPPLEAMACGCLCLISNSGGVNEFATPDWNCIMFEPKNDKELAEKLTLAINNFPTYETLVTNGISSTKEFSWEKSSKQLTTILNACLVKTNGNSEC